MSTKALFSGFFLIDVYDLWFNSIFFWICCTAKFYLFEWWRYNWNIVESGVKHLKPL